MLLRELLLSRSLSLLRELLLTRSFSLLRKLLLTRGLLLLRELSLPRELLLPGGMLLLEAPLLLEYLLLLLHELLLSRGLLLSGGLLLFLLFATLFFLALAIAPGHDSFSNDSACSCPGAASDRGTRNGSGWTGYCGSRKGSRRRTGESAETCASAFSRCALGFLACIRGTSGKTRRGDTKGESNYARAEHDDSSVDFCCMEGCSGCAQPASRAG